MISTPEPLRGGSSPPGAFYIPAPRDKGRKVSHVTICTNTNRQGQDQTRNNRARMAIKAGDPGKRPGNIPADAGGVQSGFKRITGRTKRNYHLGRLSPAFFTLTGASISVRLRAARFLSSALIWRFKAFSLLNGMRYGAIR